MAVRNTWWIAVALCIGGSLAGIARAGTVSSGGFGALGDSYTDEYQFYPPDRSQARNYVEMLASQRGLNFGAFSSASRGDPRNQGFAYNWALSGATSDQMAQAQLPGLAQQVKAGNVQTAFMFIGGDDFQDLLSPAVLASPDPAALITAATQKISLNIQAAVLTLQSADPSVRIVVGTIPDVTLLPVAQQLLKQFPTAQPLATALSQAIAGLDQQLALLNGSPNIAVADLAGVFNDLETRPTLTVGGRTIDRITPGDDPNHLFLADGIHAGTVGQGFIANAFIDALDAKFGAGITPLTDAEILAVADGAAGGSASVPLPAGAWAGIITLPLVVIAMRRKTRVGVC